jgi:hypothetical protein
MGLLAKCVGDNKCAQSRLDESVERALRLRFLTGQFDPVESTDYTKIGMRQFILSTEA